MPYLGKQSEQVGVSVQKYEYLQGTDTSSGTTSFSVPSDSGDHVNVWLNGILLKEGGSNDYSKSNTAITFNSAPSDNDLIRIDVVESFALPDALKSSGDTMEGALKLDGGIKQQTSADLSGTYADHQLMLSDSFSVTGDVTISDNLILSKLSDDGNAITLTNDGSTRTIEGAGGSLETSTLAQTPNASLTGMTGEISSSVLSKATFEGTLNSSTTFSGDAGQKTAKAWCNFSGTGTPSIQTSFNCSSLTDVDVGRWEVNYTTPMSSQYHAPVSAQGGSVVYVMVVNEDQNAGAGKCEIGNYRWDTGAYGDTGHVYVIVFGD